MRLISVQILRVTFLLWNVVLTWQVELLLHLRERFTSLMGAIINQQLDHYTTYKLKTAQLWSVFDV